MDDGLMDILKNWFQKGCSTAKPFIYFHLKKKDAVRFFQFDVSILPTKSLESFYWPRYLLDAKATGHIFEALSLGSVNGTVHV